MEASNNGGKRGSYEATRNTKSLRYEAKKIEKELDMPNATIVLNETAIEYARCI